MQSFSLTISLRAECLPNQLRAFVYAHAIPLQIVNLSGKCWFEKKKKILRCVCVCFTLSDVDLLVCKHQGPSCCTRKMEESYQFAVRRETLHNIHSYSYELEHLLSGHSDAFQGKCTPLLPSLSWMGLVWEAGENIGVAATCHWFLIQNQKDENGNIVFSFLEWKEHLSGIWWQSDFFFSSSSVHQGHSSLHVSQRAAQKCGHSFTFLPSSLLLRVWQEHSCGDETKKAGGWGV